MDVQQGLPVYIKISCRRTLQILCSSSVTSFQDNLTAQRLALAACWGNQPSKRKKLLAWTAVFSRRVPTSPLHALLGAFIVLHDSLLFLSSIILKGFSQSIRHKSQCGSDSACHTSCCCLTFHSPFFFSRNI